MTFFLGSAELTNCTIAGNSAGSNGGGLYNFYGSAGLTNCTISGNNAAVQGGGIDNFYLTPTFHGTTSLLNTIVAGNTGPSGASAISGPVTGKNNLIGTGGSGGLVNGVGGNLVGVANPHLGALANNGGPTQTIALLPGSPAIGAGLITPAVPENDQRGAPRVGSVDIGAYQTLYTGPLVVNTAINGVVVAGKETLDNAVSLANYRGGNQTVSFDTTVFATHKTITLPGHDLEISNTTGTVTIQGPAAGLTVNAVGLSRVFQVDPGVTASISGLTITGGSAIGDGALVLGNGGGVYNDGGSITLANCTVSGDSASLDGGGIFSSGDGSTTLTNSTVSGDTAGLDGGGLYDYGDGSITLTNCTISGDTATSGGGGVFIYGGTGTLTNTKIVGNTASGTYSNGGGVLASYTALTMTGCTVSGNSSGDLGGGVAQYGGSLVLGNSTIIGNSARAGAGLFQDGGTDTLTNVTINGNLGDVPGFDFGGGVLTVVGTFTMKGGSISGNSSGYGGGLGTGSDSTVTLTGVTISGNTATGEGGGVLSRLFDDVTLTGCTISGNTAATGGGVFNYLFGYLTMAGSTISGNTALNGGGAIVNTFDSTLTLTGSTVTNNSAVYGGGLLNESSSTATLTNCTVSGNSAKLSGGGVEAIYFATTTLTGCTVSGNSATQDGGGLYNLISTLNMTNCTVSGNSAANGGGLYSTGRSFAGYYVYYNYSGTASLTNCTVSGNTATITGGGLYNGGYGYATLVNTIVAVNSGPSGASDIIGAGTVSGNNNLIGTGGSGGLVNGVGGNLVGVANPHLGALANNGGPTQTIALLSGSPAIGGGIGGAGIPTTDQRGLPRNPNSIDIGAYQTQPEQVVAIRPVFSPTAPSAVIGTSSTTASPAVVTSTSRSTTRPMPVGFNGVVSGPTPKVAPTAPSGGFATLGAGGIASVSARANPTVYHSSSPVLVTIASKLQKPPTAAGKTPASVQGTIRAHSGPVTASGSTLTTTSTLRSTSTSTSATTAKVAPTGPTAVVDQAIHAIGGKSTARSTARIEIPTDVASLGRIAAFVGFPNVVDDATPTIAVGRPAQRKASSTASHLV